MVEMKAVSSLTEVTACNFVSPKVTIMASRNLMVFGFRFGFLSGPSKRQQSNTTRRLLKDQKLEVSISNSMSTSEKLVIAGYILLKAPNTTHWHYYTQYLRSKLPDVTPYFDIVRYKKTPMDQIIPHLVVHAVKSISRPSARDYCQFSMASNPLYSFQGTPLAPCPKIKSNATSKFTSHGVIR